MFLKVITKLALIEIIITTLIQAFNSGTQRDLKQGKINFVAAKYKNHLGGSQVNINFCRGNKYVNAQYSFWSNF